MMLRALWLSLPALSRLGLAIVGAGLATDVVHHMFTQEVDAARVLGIGFIGHGLTLAGMVLALLGVVGAAADVRRRARQKGDTNAARSSATATR